MHCRFMSVTGVWQAAGAAALEHAVTAVQLGASSVLAAPVIIEPLAERELLCKVRVSGCLIEVALAAL
jgi:hypothetical protein